GLSCLRAAWLSRQGSWRASSCYHPPCLNIAAPPTGSLETREHRRSTEIATVSSRLVRAEWVGRHTPSFFRRQGAHRPLPTPRFVFQPDPAQLADQFCPFPR